VCQEDLLNQFSAGYVLHFGLLIAAVKPLDLPDLHHLNAVPRLSFPHRNIRCDHIFYRLEAVAG
jgi:hypothetical protein